MKFTLYRACKVGGKSTFKEGRNFSTPKELFNFLAVQGHKTDSAALYNAEEKPRLQVKAESPADFAIVYESHAADEEECTVVLDADVECYYVMQAQIGTEEEDLTFGEFSSARDSWAGERSVDTSSKDVDVTHGDRNKKKPPHATEVVKPPRIVPTTLAITHSSSNPFLSFVYKALHPGNTLFVAVVLTAVGIGLIGFGVACPPALVFVALGFAAFSAISTIGYAIDWFKRDWSVYKAKTEATLQKASLRDYLENCWNRLKQWIPNHKPQAIMMGVGAVVFLGALAVVAGHFIAIAVTGAGFAFMTIGASGGALGLTSSFFAAGLSSVSVSASLATLLTSVFAGAALIVGPTNIVDSIRRFVSGIYKKITEDELPPDNPNKILIEPAVKDQRQIKLGFTQAGTPGSSDSFSTPSDVGKRGAPLLDEVKTENDENCIFELPISYNASLGAKK